ncbi:cell wall-binding repeat-containing protein [Raoultibacter phocaeensis]|uniref:cell wall-binding repeat-containing protein n=1 Tax=Raoultibacter phocaeensis TaxID=2479841 RepID=UPI0011189BBA|nr:cell wall-binding repeat-containing protein [Raoultibacter phocaeensis]
MEQKRTSGFLAAALSLTVAITLIFGVQPAWAFVEGDQSLLSDEEIEAAIESGEVISPNDEGGVEALSEAAPTAVVEGTMMKTFSGANRYETAALQATYGWQSSRYAVVAGGYGWPDALTASSLAGALDCPVLLTPKEGLDASASQALSSLGVSHVVVVGDENAVSAAAADAIGAKGIAVERLGGADRYATQMEIYRYGADPSKNPEGRVLWGSDAVVLASGVSPADALSASPVAFCAKAPVFLADASCSLNADQLAALSSAGGFATALVMGDTNRVSKAAESAAAAASGRTERFAGADRYDTSARVAKWGIQNGFLGSWEGSAFATGQNPADALGGGALQGRERSPLLLVDDGWCGYAMPNIKTVSSVKVFGDRYAVSGSIRMEIADTINGMTYADIPGLKVYIDAGHGWNSSNNGVMDYGATGNGLTEWELTKDLADRVGKKLKNEYGMDVYVNNTGGWYKLRQTDAYNRGCDLFVSIHFNASCGSGTESYIHSYRADWKSADLQAKVHPSLVKAMGLRDRGTMDAEFAVCGGELPAVLLEVCFIDNASDIRTYLGRKDAVAKAIASGIAS